MKTDYIDLYQIHWPNRGHFHFRGAGATILQAGSVESIRRHRGDRDALGDCREAGKLKAFGLSNETTWGYAEVSDACQKRQGLPRVATIQNEYNLLYRHYDLDLAELSHHEDVGLLAYSPLAAAFSQASISTEKAGRFAWLDQWRHRRPPGAPAGGCTRAYVELAKGNGLDPSAMALAFCLTRPFMASVIIGATTMDQLKVNIGAADLKLSDEVLQEIAKIHRQYPMPI